MIDNFAIPAATIRGLFDCDYRSDRLILRPHVPGTITKYTQKDPIRFGEKHLYLSCINGGSRVKSVTINGKTLNIKKSDTLALYYDILPKEAQIEITTEGGWPKETSTSPYPTFPALISDKVANAAPRAELSDSLKNPYTVLSAMKKLLTNVTNADYEKAFVNAAIATCEDYQVRVTMETGPGYFRPLTQERKEGINKFYEQAALSMYTGYCKRMADFAEKGDQQQKNIASLFAEAQKNQIK
jgi:hypothetical protein